MNSSRRNCIKNYKNFYQKLQQLQGKYTFTGYKIKIKNKLENF